MKLKTQILFTSFILTFTCILFGACDHEDWYADSHLILTDEMHGSLKNGNVVATGDATNLTSNSVTILCSANYNYKESLGIKPYIVYGINGDNITNNGIRVDISDFNSSACKVTLTNLNPSTEYYYYVAADASNGDRHKGEIKKFITGGNAVDLGLSVKWSDVNIGTDAWAGSGVTFYWGGTKTSSDAYRADWHEFSLSTLINQGYIDNNFNLCSKYDAATQAWGDKWRMPTKAEFQELINKCSWKAATRYSGFRWYDGFDITGRNGNFIFLPTGVYWSSTANSSDAFCLRVYVSSYKLDTKERSSTLIIRPVSK